MAWYRVDLCPCLCLYVLLCTVYVCIFVLFVSMCVSMSMRVCIVVSFVLSVSMCVSICVSMAMLGAIDTHRYTLAWVCIYVLCLSICVSMYCLCLYVYLWPCVCVCVYLCPVCVNIYMYIYGHACDCVLPSSLKVSLLARWRLMVATAWQAAVFTLSPSADSSPTRALSTSCSWSSFRFSANKPDRICVDAHPWQASLWICLKELRCMRH